VRKDDDVTPEIAAKVKKAAEDLGSMFPKAVGVPAYQARAFRAADHVLAEQNVVRTVRLHPDTISDLAKAIVAELKGQDKLERKIME
jgi:hypothetical protein